MANPNNKNKSGNNLQNFLKKKSSKLKQVGRQREQAEQEMTLKKKRKNEKKTLLDSVMKKPTETVSNTLIQNFTKDASKVGANMKETIVSKTSNAEKDTFVDFLEKKSSLQTQILKRSTLAEPKNQEYPTAKNQKDEKSFDGTEKEQSERNENQKKWIQGLIKNALEEQQKWTKGLINDLKKELIKSEKSQKESIKVLIKSIMEEQMQSVKNLKTKGSERRGTGVDEEPKRTVIKKSLKKTVPHERKEKIVKKVTPLSKKVR